METQVSLRVGTTPVFVAADGNAPRVVLAVTGTVYYGGQSVLSTTGVALAQGASVTLDSGQWFVAASEQRVSVSEPLLPARPKGVGHRRRLSYNVTSQQAEWHDGGYLTLQDFYPGDYTWNNNLGGVVRTASLGMCENTLTPFTKADEGKYVVVTLDSGGRDMQQIDSVDAQGRATMRAPFSSKATNTRTSWGLDAGTRLTDAMASMVASNANPKAFRTPGWYRCNQIILPNGIRYEGSGWGNSMGPSVTSNRDAGTAGTILQQMPGANIDFIRFAEGLVNPASPSAHWIGPLWWTDMLVHGPETDIASLPYTTGWGCSLKSQDGLTSFGIEDGFWMDNIQFGFFYSGGMLLPNGCGPGMLGKLRFWYNGGEGLKYIHNNTQALSIDYISGDGNGNGLVTLQGITGTSAGPVRIGTIKSEKAGYFVVPSGSTNYQDKALTLQDCTGAVHVGQIHHLSSAPDGTGVIAPGPAVRINGSVPKFSWDAIDVRLKGTETSNVANAVAIDDHVNLITVPLANARTPGTYPRGMRDDLPNESKTVVASTPRELLNGSITCTSQKLLVAHFTVAKDVTVSKVRVFTTGTAAAATPTIGRVGLYTIGLTGNLGLNRFTANDINLLAAASTMYEKTLDSSVDLVAGVRYAVGVLVVTGAAAPTILGRSLQTQYTLTDGPLIGASLAGQANLPDTVAIGSLVASADAPYIELVP